MVASSLFVRYSSSGFVLCSIISPYGGQSAPPVRVVGATWALLSGPKRHCWMLLGTTGGVAEKALLDTATALLGVLLKALLGALLWALLKKGTA